MNILLNMKHFLIFEPIVYIAHLLILTVDFFLLIKLIRILISDIVNIHIIILDKPCDICSILKEYFK